jgi:CheY-like chemotaxis protein
VLQADSGGAALELLQRSPNLELMLLDFAMPGMSGGELAQTTRPALPILFIPATRTGPHRRGERGRNHLQAIRR